MSSIRYIIFVYYLFSHKELIKNNCINSIMNNSFTQSLNMKSLMNSDDYVNNTERIRELKHSELILEDIGKLCRIKKDHFHMKMV